MTVILDGKAFAKKHSQALKSTIADLKRQGIEPAFCVINIGQDPASKVYVHVKARRAIALGLKQQIIQLPADITTTAVVAKIQELNADQAVHGIMVQLPLPAGLDTNQILESINPEKDIDCLTATNIGRLWQGNHFIEPATAAGVMALLQDYQVPLAGKNCVILGRSKIVGKPLAALMLEANATVTVVHSHSCNLTAQAQAADILVCAVGKANFVTPEMVKPGAVVVDVGINRWHGELIGDVDYEAVYPKAKMITPVPGGIGPVTVEFLMAGVVKLTRRRYGC